MPNTDSSSDSFDDSDTSDSCYSDAEEEKKEDNEEEGADSDEEDVIKALRLAQLKKKSTRPPDITLTDTPSSICFHPSKDLIAISTFSGGCELYSYSNEDNQKLNAVQHKSVSIRDIKFNQSGDKLSVLLSNQDVVLYNTDGLQVERTIKNASQAPGMCINILDENLMAIGDDDGYVQVWDKRSDGISFALKVSEDSISSLLADAEGKVLVASALDGSLNTIKVRAKKLQTQSEIYDTSFNCMGLLKQNTKLTVGDSEGKVYVFNWGEFGLHSDMYPGHAEAVNCMIPITEKILITGGDDGYIRAVHFFPMKFLGIVGKHKFPVENMDVCNDGHLIASAGHDEIVRFWNVSYFEDFVMPAEVKTSSKATKSKDMKHNLPSSRQTNKADFFQGLKD